MNSAPSERFGCVASISPLAGMTSGDSVLVIGSGMFCSPLVVAAATTSGLQNIPDPITSTESPLVMPASGDIDATQPNRSEGALFIVKASMSLGLPYRPLVIATGGALTDVADAYLLDHTVTQRVVVVSSLGGVSESGGNMGRPNGDADPWADTIVAERFRYIQVSA